MPSHVSVKTQPAVEPVSLAELKVELRLDSGSLADNVTVSQTIAAGSYTTGTQTGTAVDLLGCEAIAILDSKANGAGGTVDVHLEESDTGSSAWTDVVSGGTFTQVTTANDGAAYEKSYTGAKRYVRAIAVVAGATCEFGVSIHAKSGQSTEDDLLTSRIATARFEAERYDGRSYVNRTLYYHLDAFPSANYIVLPNPPVQAGTAPIVTYYDVDGTAATFAATSWTLDATDMFRPRIYLNDGETWPTTTLREYAAVRIEYVAGYGATAAAVFTEAPYVKRNILRLAGYLHRHRADEAVDLDAYLRLLSWPERLVAV